MTLEEVREGVAKIDAMKGDDEVAHEAEDDLYSKFIADIAKDEGSPYCEAAKELLKTHDIEFGRWCA